MSRDKCRGWEGSSANGGLSAVTDDGSSRWVLVVALLNALVMLLGLLGHALAGWQASQSAVMPPFA